MTDALRGQILLNNVKAFGIYFVVVILMERVRIFLWMTTDEAPAPYVTPLLLVIAVPLLLVGAMLLLRPTRGANALSVALPSVMASLTAVCYLVLFRYWVAPPAVGTPGVSDSVVELSFVLVPLAEFINPILRIILDPFPFYGEVFYFQPIEILLIVFSAAIPAIALYGGIVLRDGLNTRF